MNFGEKLHNLSDSRKGVENALNMLKEEYQFEDYEIKIPHTSDIQYIAVAKNELVVSVMIATREAYDLMFSKKSERRNQGASLIWYVGEKYGQFSQEETDYIKNHYESGLQFPSHSPEQYAAFVRYDLNFIKEHYSEMFEQGIYME